MVRAFTARPAGDESARFQSRRCSRIPALRFSLQPLSRRRALVRAHARSLAVARCDALASTRMTRSTGAGVVTQHATSVRSSGYSPLTWRQHSSSTPTMKFRASGLDTQTVDLRAVGVYAMSELSTTPARCCEGRAAVVLRSVGTFAFVLRSRRGVVCSVRPTTGGWERLARRVPMGQRSTCCPSWDEGRQPPDVRPLIAASVAALCAGRVRVRGRRAARVGAHAVVPAAGVAIKPRG
jgi:hypothetical protein